MNSVTITEQENIAAITENNIQLTIQPIIQMVQISESNISVIVQTNQVIVIAQSTCLEITMNTSPFTTFLSLIDTPDLYSGNAGKDVRVNSAASALEFSADNRFARAFLLTGG